MEKFMKDPISMEERAMCKLISTYKVTINEEGVIDLDELGVYLDMNVVPRMMRRRITEFCEFLVKRFPVLPPFRIPNVFYLLDVIEVIFSFKVPNNLLLLVLRTYKSIFQTS